MLFRSGGKVSIYSTDAGADDWAGKLARECKVPLYGVYFDFNKATLKPESEPVLNRVLGILKGNTEAFELRGHTDAVGSEDFNLKLSDARAASVVAWMTQRGIDAKRLSSKGYGKSQPIADNNTDQGRAKNRRVELARSTCKAK